MTNYLEQRFRSIIHTNHIKDILHDDNNPIKNVGAIKSCIEADEPEHLLIILNNNTKAKIYSLICCFAFIPSIKCIEALIVAGTPLDMTFENNPFNSTAQEYLDKYFPISNMFDGPRYNCVARELIYDAIKRGKMRIKKSTSPILTGKPPIIKNFRSSIISLLRAENNH
jgi:hypothetical protein